MLKSQELIAQIADLHKEAKTLTVAAEVNAKVDEILNLQAQLRLVQIEEEEERIAAAAINRGVTPKGLSEVRAFANTLLGKKLTDEDQIKALSTLTDANGKLLIPQDIKTNINEFLRLYQDMSGSVNFEQVSTLTGTRIYEVEAGSTPLTGVAELVSIPVMDEPTFQAIKYSCNYLKGLMKIPNEVLKNADASLVPYLAKWIARKLIATRNLLTFYADGTKAQGLLGTPTAQGIAIDETKTAPIAISILDDILNVTLPTAISASPNCKIITNQSMFNYLVKLENTKSGARYLQPDLTKPGKYQYNGKIIDVYDDAVLKVKTIATKAQHPILVGDFTEALTLFELEEATIEYDSSVYFESDATAARVITAMDSKIVDKKSVVAVYAPIV